MEYKIERKLQNMKQLEVSRIEVKEIILGMKNGKATGRDGMKVEQRMYRDADKVPATSVG